MFEPVPSKVSLPQLEEKVLRFWRERDVFRRSVEQRRDAPLYVFYEGPPTANASPGVHHVLARVFKDVIPRFKTMQGYRVPRRGGWDTHGLPVELEIERELGISSKPEIERYGIAEFNQKCRQSVFRYVRDWEELTERIGFWVDVEDPYITCDNNYIESCWWIIKRLWEEGLVYRDYKVTPHCPRCETSLSSHEVAQGYRDDTDDPSIYVRFRLKLGKGGGSPRVLELLGSDVPTSFLAWTTTPWTLPGNVALAVAPEAEYAVVETATEDGGTERLVLASALLRESLLREYREVGFLSGRDLLGLHYEPLYTFVELEKPAHRVIGGDFVTLEDGTGIVHIAPAYGEVDLEVGRAEDLPLVSTVDLSGRMTQEATPWAGQFVKDADPAIVADLEERGLMYRSERTKHTYPFCWRCDTPLLYYAKPSWYIRTTARKERLIAGNEEINWHPDYIKHGRFGDWLENNVDWAVSRERYWGTPLPVWECEGCGAYDCVGSREELAHKSGLQGFELDMDLHRPFIDGVTFGCQQCGSTMRRVPEVLDAWFDSGAMPVAQWHYPFENREAFQASFPADFISEAVDQTRGWFYTLHAISTLLFDRPSFRNVICLGHILDAEGEKMSKSRGNVVEPWAVINAQGADALRWYLLTTSPPGNPRRFSVELVGEVARKFLMTLWNTYSFFVTYANIDGYRPPAGSAAARTELDRWVLSELVGLVEEVTRLLSEYNPTDAGRRIEAFVERLSNWYVRRSRRRFWKSEDDADKRAAYDTLYQCLTTVATLLAPFTPFVAEEMYQNLVRRVHADAPESVHLTEFPQADASLRDEALEADMELAMRLVRLGRAARMVAGIKVRQPLSEVVIWTPDADERTALERVAPQVMDELNVRSVRMAESQDELVEYEVRLVRHRVGPRLGSRTPQAELALASLGEQEKEAVVALVHGRQDVPVGEFLFHPDEVRVEGRGKPGYQVSMGAGLVVALATEITPELADEGLARELVRRIQDMRREAGFDIADRITTFYRGDEAVSRVMETHGDYICQETLSLSLVEGDPAEGAFVRRRRVDDHQVELGVLRR